jgi:hypothetical protein
MTSREFTMETNPGAEVFTTLPASAGLPGVNDRILAITAVVIGTFMVHFSLRAA